MNRFVVPALVLLLMIGSLTAINVYIPPQTAHNILGANTTRGGVYQKAQVSYKLPPATTFATAAVSPGTTALDLMRQVAQIKTNGDGISAFVTEINGQTADESQKEFWAFYVNGKQAEVGAGSYVLKDKDQVEWKIEHF